MRIEYLSVYVVARCNMVCPHCNQVPWRSANPQYSLDPTWVDRIIDRTKKLGGHYGTIRLTGGEAPLWPYYTEAVNKLLDSGICDTVGQFSNGHPDALPILEPLIPRLGHVRFTIHEQTDRHTARKLARQHKHVQLIRERHRPPPTTRDPGSLPAQCRCTPQAFWNGRFTTCSLVPALVAAEGGDWLDARYSCDIDDNFFAHYLARKEQRYGNSICMRCTMNERAYT